MFLVGKRVTQNASDALECDVYVCIFLLINPSYPAYSTVCQSQSLTQSLTLCCSRAFLYDFMSLNQFELRFCQCLGHTAFQKGATSEDITTNCRRTAPPSAKNLLHPFFHELRLVQNLRKFYVFSKALSGCDLQFCEIRVSYFSLRRTYVGLNQTKFVEKRFFDDGGSIFLEFVVLGRIRSIFKINSSWIRNFNLLINPTEVENPIGPIRESKGPQLEGLKAPEPEVLVTVALSTLFSRSSKRLNLPISFSVIFPVSSRNTRTSPFDQSCPIVGYCYQDGCMRISSSIEYKTIFTRQEGRNSKEK